MLEKANKLQEKALAELETATSIQNLQDWKKKYLNKDSELLSLLKGIKDLPANQRSEAGSAINEVKNTLSTEFNKKNTQIERVELDKQLETEFIDLTLPGIPSNSNGGLHPITKERKRVEEIFINMGFEVKDPFILDTDYNNFTAVNIPEGHPARDMWDTIRTDIDEVVMITHTSSMQNRIISGGEPPIRAIVPGKTFRNEATDARHEHSFFQVEGVYIDKGIKLSDLIGTLQHFLEYYFEKEMKIKIQPTYFPFVEPGLEIMMECPVCNGKKPANCAGCGGFGWMEIIPCGPIHPHVITEGGLDPEVYSGFAWGLGLDRLVMIKNAINDIRNFHSGRIDFIDQF